MTGMHCAGCQGAATAWERLSNRARWHQPRTTHVPVSELQTLLAQSPLMSQSSPLGHFLLSEAAAQRPPQSVSVSKAASSALLAQMSWGSGVRRQGCGVDGTVCRWQVRPVGACCCGEGTLGAGKEQREPAWPRQLQPAAPSPCHAVLRGSTNCTISRQGQKAWACSPPVSARWWPAGRSRRRCGQRHRWCTPGWRAAG